MKKFVAIVLLFACLFNISGQLLVHQYLAWQSERFYDFQTNRGLYNINDLTQVIIPSDMPTIAGWSSYQNISGSVTFQNASYNYVKMKITKHAIYLMCVPNYSTTHLSGQNSIIVKNISAVPVSKKNHVPYGKTTLLDKLNLTFTYGIKVSFETLNHKFLFAKDQLINHPANIPAEPPRFHC